MTGRGWQAERLSGATRVRPTDDERNPPAGAHLAKHVGGWRRRGRRWGEVGALWPVRSQCEPTTDAPRERAHSRTRESRTSSKSTSVLGENADICSPVAWSRTTPSYVAFTDAERLIGEAAKNQVLKNSQSVTARVQIQLSSSP